MSQPKQPFLAKHSTAKIGIIALALIFLALILAIYPTVTFVKTFTQDTLHPLALFESGEPFEFTDDDPYSGYLLSMTVTERNMELPEMDLSITDSQGNQVQGTEINIWNSVMGREYKQFLKLPPQQDGKLTIEIQTPENEDFLIFRRISDVLDKAKSRALPLWILSAIPLVLGIGCLLIILIRAINSSSQVNLHVSS